MHNNASHVPFHDAANRHDCLLPHPDDFVSAPQAAVSPTNQAGHNIGLSWLSTLFCPCTVFSDFYLELSHLHTAHPYSIQQWLVHELRTRLRRRRREALRFHDSRSLPGPRKQDGRLQIRLRGCSSLSLLMSNLFRPKKMYHLQAALPVLSTDMRNPVPNHVSHVPSFKRSKSPKSTL